MLPYSLFLAASGLVLSLAERIWPRDPRQHFLRRGFALDLFYLFLNAEIVGASVAIWITRYLPSSAILPFRDLLHLNGIAAQSIGLQLFVLLISKDFLQWNVHNLMHRVPLLWQFHRTHHSSTNMDWLSNWRFHWVEIVVYQAVLYIPATLLGFSEEATYGCAIISTAVGHFAHANLRLRIGPIKYILNCPEMHSWHHVHPDYGPQNRNFAITFTLWDWLFHTAYLPSHDPERLGVRQAEVPL
jgi:sterol desaturase/sphingolipid hydroxylase (fatty acid hydroxylase superfamily)